MLIFIQILLNHIFCVLLASERRIFSLEKNGQKPSYILDGMTNDRDGNLYMATFGGSKVIKMDPK